MSKSVLVIDTPKTCVDCIFCQEYRTKNREYAYCYVTNGDSENDMKLIDCIYGYRQSNKITIYCNEETIKEASKIIEDEEKIKDAVSLVRTFAKYPDRTALTGSFIEALKLLADTVESQLEEVK